MEISNALETRRPLRRMLLGATRPRITNEQMAETTTSVSKRGAVSLIFELNVDAALL